MKLGLVAAAAAAGCLLSPARAFDVEAVKPGVPRIVLLQQDEQDRDTWHFHTGSGFVVHSEGDAAIVATNFHVIDEYKPGTLLYVLRKVEGGIEAHIGEIIARSKERDLALLRVPGFKAKELPLLTVEPGQAEDVYSIGYPAVADDDQTCKKVLKVLKDGHEGVLADQDGAAGTYLEASVSKAAVRRVVTGNWPNRGGNITFRIIEHDVNIGHGNSGGPLFNGAGQVVGVNTAGKFNAKGADVDKFSESSHISSLMEFLKDEHVDFVQTDTVATAPGPVAAGTEGGGGMRFMLIVATGVAAVALAIALGKRQAIVESYTHYVRRASAPPRKPGGAAGNENAAPDNKPSKPLCVLEGENPEGGKQIRFVISDKLLAEASQRVVLGRSRRAHFCIHNSSISGEHLVLHCRNGSFQVEDRQSSNGTRINGKKIPPLATVPLADGDKLEIGDVILRFQSLA